MNGFNSRSLQIFYQHILYGGNRAQLDQREKKYGQDKDKFTQRGFFGSRSYYKSSTNQLGLVMGKI